MNGLMDDVHSYLQCIGAFSVLVHYQLDQCLRYIGVLSDYGIYLYISLFGALVYSMYWSISMRTCVFSALADQCIGVSSCLLVPPGHWCIRGIGVNTTTTTAAAATCYY